MWLVPVHHFCAVLHDRTANATRYRECGQLNLAHVGLTRNKQVCARPEGRYDMRALPDDYR